ncbi:hypothetical protein KR084_007746 [Drosophila pseudotakahashii]|nr:hypothetical protein KR084_007746 [Drosophila pseudotakahashii]
MKYANLLAICASLLLLKLDTAATTATVDGPSRELIVAAQTIGLDEVGLRELWRTRQPLVIRNQNDAGQLTSVTFELNPDGRSISRRRLVEELSTSSSPARLEDGSTSNKPREQWEFLPNSVRQHRPTGESNFGMGNFDPSIFATGFPRAPLFPNWEVPAGVKPQVSTKTEVDNQGNKVTTTTRTYSGTFTPGSNVFQQLFPDISREPGPLNPELDQNPISPSSRTGPFDSGFSPRPSQQDPVFVPVREPTTTPRTWMPLPTLSPPKPTDESDKVIDNFLERVDLKPADIENRNGELVKTIVDKNGRVLTARFVLSSVKGAEEEPKQQRPTK